MYQGNLTATQRERLLKLLRLTASDQVGERAAAAARAHSLMSSIGTDWDDVIIPAIGDDMAVVLRAERHRHALSDWDSKFVASVGAMLRSGLMISIRQRQQLQRIALEAEAKAS